MIATLTNQFAKNYYIRKNGVWTESDLWMKFGEEWHQLVPPNCIILYDTPNWTGTIADGSNGSLNLIDKYPRLGKNEFSFEGYEGHEGADHGEYTPTIDSSLNIQNSTNISLFGLATNYTTNSSHTHRYLEPHTHTGWQKHDYYHYSVIPTMYNDVIRPGALFLSADNITADFFILLDNLNRLLKFGTSSGNGGIEPGSHSHNSVELTTTTDGVSTGNTKSVSGTYTEYLNNHYHKTTHLCPTSTVKPTQQTYFLKKTQQPIYWDMLPKNTIVLCITDYIPAGWERFTPEAASLIYAGNSFGTLEGSDTHTHAETASTGYVYSGSSIRWRVGGQIVYRIENHSHTFFDNHSVPQPLTPPSVNLYAIRKS